MEKQTVKTNQVDVKSLRSQHEIYKLAAEIAEFRLRQVLADMRYMEVVAKFNAPTPEQEVPDESKEEMVGQ